MMKRGLVSTAMCACIAALLLAATPGAADLARHGAFPRYDVVISGGRVMDPETGFDREANIGIVGDRIALITPHPLPGRQVINASGMVVSPGFIDLCVAGRPGSARSSRNIEAWKVSDGVTSVLFLHDGTGDLPAYRRILEGAGHYANIGFSTRVWDYLYRGYSLEEKLELVRANLDSGALGVSASPEYTPEVDTEELLAYGRLAREYGVPLFLHLRYSSRERELEGVAEAVRVAEETGARLHIFHLPSTGGTFRMDQALDMLHRARRRGARITADLYAYTYWATYINAARFNPGWQERYGLAYQDLFYVPTEEHLTEAAFNRYRRRGGLIVVPENTMSLERSVIPALRDRFVYIASDSSCGVPFGGEVPSVGHPRGTNNFARALHLSRQAGIPLMDMLRKMTLGPARVMEGTDPSFRRRGRLQEGCYADITVFDYRRVNGEGTVLNRAVPSRGIHAVLVNGRVVYRDGEPDGAGAGRFLLRGEGPP